MIDKIDLNRARRARLSRGVGGAGRDPEGDV